MQLSEYIKENEKIFTDNPKVKYFTKLNANSKYLLVIFSAFNGKEKEGMPATYNYVKPLFDLEINQLYILDSSSSGLPTYYLGEGNLEYEIKVIQLILEIAKSQNINISNIITAGTSKGGTAAAYFAMKYSLGAFISGGMQTKAGDYLYNESDFVKNVILTKISGIDDVVKSRDYLNNRLMHIFDNPKNNTQYHLHGGSGDHHFQDYVQPFIERLREHNIKYDLNIENYNQHSDLATYFVPYLLKTLTKLTDLEIEIENQPLVKISVSDNSANVIIDATEKDEIYYAIYLYKVDEQNPVKKLMYQKSNIFNISDLESGKYRTRIFIKDKSNNTNSYSVGRFIIK